MFPVSSHQLSVSLQDKCDIKPICLHFSLTMFPVSSHQLSVSLQDKCDIKPICLHFSLTMFPVSSHQLSVSLQKDKCDITLTAQNRGTDTTRDLQAQLDVKSTMRKTSLRSLSVAAAHKDNGQQLTNNVDVTLNGKVYSYGANMDMGPGSNTGDLTLTWPRQQVRLHPCYYRDTAFSFLQPCRGWELVCLDDPESFAGGRLVSW